MAPIGSSLLDILQPPGNQWLENLIHSAKPLPAGVRVVRYEDGESEVFESGAFPHPVEHKTERDLSHH